MKVKKAKKNALNVVCSFSEMVADVDTREADLFSNVTGVSCPIERSTAELCHMHDMVSMQSKELANILELTLSIESLENNVASYEARKELKSEFAEVIKNSTRL